MESSYIKICTMSCELRLDSKRLTLHRKTDSKTNIHSVTTNFEKKTNLEVVSSDSECTFHSFRSSASEIGTPRSSTEFLLQKMWRLPRQKAVSTSKKKSTKTKPSVLSDANRKSVPKRIINDLNDTPIDRDQLALSTYTIDSDVLASSGYSSDSCRGTLIRSCSYDSIVSGVSGGTTASEERQGLLQCLRSFSSLSSKDTSSPARSLCSRSFVLCERLETDQRGRNK